MVLIVALLFIVVGMIGSAIEAGRQKQRQRRQINSRLTRIGMGLCLIVCVGQLRAQDAPVPFKGTISNLSAEPAPYIPDPTLGYAAGVGLTHTTVNGVDTVVAYEVVGAVEPIIVIGGAGGGFRPRGERHVEHRAPIAVRHAVIAPRASGRHR